jgi:hypothetical protein
MEEERLIHLLRGLPREMAPGGFTTQVLRRLDGQPSQASPVTPAGDRLRRRPAPQRWHRLMVATATVAALGVSVGVSVGVLQRERSPLPLAASLGPSLANAPSSGSWTAARGEAVTVASPMDRTFRHEGAAAELAELPAMASGRQGAAGPRRGAPAAHAALAAPTAMAALDAAQAHQLLRELQLERGRLARELRSLRQPGGRPPAVLYLGGNESFDLVLSTGRTRAQSSPAGERDDGEDYPYL